MPPKKHTISFRKIHPTAIDEKYQFSILFNLDKKSIPEKCTKITDLSEVQGAATLVHPHSFGEHCAAADVILSQAERFASNSGVYVVQNPHAHGKSTMGEDCMTTTAFPTPVNFSYLDESKKDHHCVVTMLPHCQEHQLPPSTQLHCFWCRHAFMGRPVGCPIRYNAHRLIKSYQSEITKDSYILRENISVDQLKDSLPYYTKQDMELQPRDYYITDGVFCSFNCAYAFIIDHKTNPLYIFSLNLLFKMYHDTLKELHKDNAHFQIPPLEPAPSWRLLKTYGGHMTIDDFRKNFSKVDYRDIDNIMFPFPSSKPVGLLFEKQIRI
jgi:hypothetical protein